MLVHKIKIVLTLMSPIIALMKYFTYMVRELFGVYMYRVQLRHPVIF